MGKAPTVAPEGHQGQRTLMPELLLCPVSSKPVLCSVGDSLLTLFIPPMLAPLFPRFLHPSILSCLVTFQAQP